MELRTLISLINNDSHPDFVFTILHECRKRVRLDTDWRELGINELELLVQLNVCQHRHMIRELKRILAKNQQAPLTKEDAQMISGIYQELARYPAELRGINISLEVLDYIIYFASCGYEEGLELAV